MELEFKEFEFGGVTYKVNQEGTIINEKGEKLKSRLNVDGYCIVTLGGNKKRREFRVHRLVAKAFIPNPENKAEVNHKDFNRQNNHLDNLEWLTHKENILHTVKAGRHISSRDLTGENNPNYKNDTLKRYYEENPEEKLKLARKGSQNGMARKVSVYRDDVFLGKFDYIGKCAEWLVENKYTKSQIDGIRSNITISVKKNKKYLGLIFKFEE